jgi:AcrR family transcriptional regulator
MAATTKPRSRRKTSSSQTRTTKRPAARRGQGTRALQKEAVRKRIVDAALALFQSKGFDQTTTRQIAQKAKLAEGTIFNYFETKEDIALYFLQLEVDHAIATVRSTPRLRRAPLEEKLFALVEAQLEFLAPHEKFIGAAFVHALRPTSKIAFSMQALDLRNRYLGFVQELIEDSDSVPSGSLLTWAAPSLFWIYYLGMLLYWLNDASKGKQHTLALLDRSLTVGVAMLRKGSL